MTEYLSWKIVFQKPYQAYDRGNLEKQVEAMAELEIIGKIYKIMIFVTEYSFFVRKPRRSSGNNAE